MEVAKELTDAKPAQRRSWMAHLPSALFLLVLLGLPVVTEPYSQSLITRILIFAILAVSLDLVYGYTGLPSLGHAAYFGMGAYAVGVVVARLGIDSFWIIAPVSILLATLTAALFGIVALRVSGMYFLLVTFAIGQLLYSVAWKWKWLAKGGVEGLAGITKPVLGIAGFSWNTTYFYYFVALAFVVTYYLFGRLTQSPFGTALKGIREGEARMRALGYQTWLFKYMIFVIAGATAGMAGMLFAYHTSIVLPVYFDITYSALAFLMVIIGGAGTLYGPVAGAVLIGLLEYYSSSIIPDRWPLVLGAVFVVSALYTRAGVAVPVYRWWERMLAKWTH